MHNFTIKVTYFKPTGKFYSSHTFLKTTTNCGSPKSPCCRMDEVIDWIKFYRERQDLPGLNCGWDGPILVTCEEGYPCLIMGEDS